jgi:hypothetical protein
MMVFIDDGDGGDGDGGDGGDGDDDCHASSLSYRLFRGWGGHKLGWT